MNAQALLDRIQQLEEVLGADRTLEGQIRDLLHIEPRKAQIVGMLFKREFVHRKGLYTVLYEASPEHEWPDEKVLDAQICKLRPHLEPFGITIETRWGDGWAMPKASKDKLRSLLAGGASMEVSAQIISMEQFKMWGAMGGKAGASKGGKRRAKTMSKRARQRVATHAARMRWSKRA